MNAKELVKRWKERQAEILGTLPEAVRTEYNELTVAIRRAEFEFAGRKRAASKNGQATMPSDPVNFGRVLEKMSQRVPLEERKQQVVSFLEKNGPSSRSDILSATSIPNGSLSNVLLDTEAFEKNDDGLWQLVHKRS
jgi:hypothetical protein